MTAVSMRASGCGLCLLFLAALNAPGQGLNLVEVVWDDEVPGLTPTLPNLSFPDDIVISPDSKHVYVVASLDDAINVFSRNPTNGRLTFVHDLVDGTGGVDGLDSARGVAISPDGKHVYVAALTDSSISAFSRNAASGELLYVQTMFDTAGIPLGGANAVVVSPDGQHVYVAARSQDGLVVFSRNAANGQLALIEWHADGLGGVNGLDAAEDVAISPDGLNVYVAGQNDNAVAVFTRNPVDGKLTFLEAKVDGVGGADGLDDASRVTVSPDGLHVYVGDEVDLDAPADGDWIGVYSRSGVDGSLTFVQVLPENLVPPSIGVGPNEADPVVSSDGMFVYVSQPQVGPVATFSRHPATGVLTLTHFLPDINFAFTPGSTIAMALSPDDRFLYLAGGAQSHVSTLATRDSYAAEFVTDPVIVGANFVATFEGLSATGYRVDANSNLVTGLWTPLMTITSGMSGVITFTNVLSGSSRSTVFRSVRP